MLNEAHQVPSVGSDKVCSLAEAVGLVRDGDMVALAGMATQSAPMAVVRELIRQGRRQLGLVCLVGGIGVDWLAAAGVIDRVVCCAVSMEQFGTCRQFARAAESGRVRVQELSEWALLARLAAAAQALPYLPIRGLVGTDLIAADPDNLRVLDDPFGGAPVVACRRLVPDVAVLHAHRADRVGNVQCEPGARWADASVMPKAARRVLVTVEEIVDSAVLRRHPDRTVLPGFLVDAVVEVPHGAHPTSLPDRYDYDTRLHREWVAAARDNTSSGAFLDRYLHTPPDEQSYLVAVGLGTRNKERAGRDG